MPNIPRGFEFMCLAIEGVEDLDELDKLCRFAWECYAGDERFTELMRRTDRRAGEIAERMLQAELFPGG